MHSIFLPLFTAGLATFAHAYTQPGANTWGPLLTPDLTHPVTQGKDFTVTWNPEDHPTDGVTVSLVLCRGPGSNCVPDATAIASSLPADQKSFDWKVPCDLAPGQQETATGYGMLIIVDGTGEFQYSTQFSVLENKSCAKSSSSSSSSSSPVPPAANITTTAPGGSIVIGPPAYQTGTYTWTSTAVDNGTTITVTGITTSIGRAPWGGEATTTPTPPESPESSSPPAGSPYGGSHTWPDVPGTTVLSTTVYPAPTTTPAGAATQTASGAATGVSRFPGAAEHLGWNPAGLVAVGAVALFAL